MTLSDIAKLANVSESTVSRALRNNSLVSQATRDRVQEIARQHNFKVNAAARNLRLQRTNTIAVIVMFDNHTGQSISDPFLLEILGTIADELSEYDYDMLLTTTRSSGSDWNNYYLESKRADGLLIIGQGDDKQRITDLMRHNIPFVVWGGSDAQDFTCIASDNVSGAEKAVTHLLEQGCKRIVFLGDNHHEEIDQRLIGYKNAHKTAGCPVDENLVIETDFTSSDGYKKVESLLAEGCEFDGIFAVSDAIAVGAMKCLQENAVAIPEQVAVVGFDDVAMAEFVTPSLTTVRQQTKTGGQLLVKTLMQKINKEDSRSVSLDAELVVRQSSQRQ